jgi:hypothetical protein
LRSIGLTLVIERDDPRFWMQTHGVLTCLYEVLLHAECEAAVSYAQATDVARDLIDRSAEQVDSVRIQPLLDVLGALNKVDQPRVLCVS